MLSEECKDRLLNFKFSQASGCLDGQETVEERNLVLSMGNMLGDPGWFNGYLEIIIWAALRSIGVSWEDVIEREPEDTLGDAPEWTL